MVPADEAIPTIDGEWHICEDCYEAEQAAIFEANPELVCLKAWVPGPEVA